MNYIDIVDPKLDYAFKKIFGEKESIFIDFVNSVFENSNKPLIKKITFINTELNKDTFEDKKCILDVQAELETGEKINVEIQLSSQKDYVKRSLFYWSKLYCSQIKKGQYYFETKRCIGIHILNFDLFPNNPNYHRVVSLCDIETNENICDDLEIHYLSLPKIPKQYSEKLTHLESWLLFLETNNLQIYRELSKNNKVIDEALDTLYFLSQDKMERAYYEFRNKELGDIKARELEIKEKNKVIEEREQVIEELQRKLLEKG
jgi:predicted transposase/invertase (TIGR01784 family)